MPTYPPPVPTERQQMMATMLALEIDPAEVADTLNIPLSYVKLMLKSSLFLTKVKEEKDKFIKGKQVEAEEYIAKTWIKATKVIEQLMDNSEDEKVILDAAKTILNKGPIFTKQQVTEKREMKVTFTPAQTKAIEAVLVDDVENGPSDTDETAD